MKKISPALPKMKESYSQPEDFFGTFFRNPKNNTYGWKPAKAYTPGIEIFQQDTPANNVYFIERGLVKLCNYLSPSQALAVGGTGDTLRETLCIHSNNVTPLFLNDYLSE